MTKRRKLTITTASLLLVIVTLYIVFMPALERARCCAWTLQVSTWQRAIAQNLYEKRGTNQIPPTSFLRIIAEVDHSGIYFGQGVEAYCWDQKNESVRIGNISLEDILEGRATLDDVDAEVARLNLPVPRWEVFGGLAFLVYDPADQLRSDLPVMFACMSRERSAFNIGYEDGHAAFSRSVFESVEEMQSILTSANLPEIPQTYIDQNIIPPP